GLLISSNTPCERGQASVWRLARWPCTGTRISVRVITLTAVGCSLVALYRWGIRACLLYGSLSMANHKSREGRWRGGNGFAHQTRTKSGSEAWRLSFTDGAGNKRKTASYQGLPAARDTVFSQQSVSRTSRMGQRSQSGDFLQMVFPRCTTWAW
ncbi:MAG: hypothetical protein PWQ69_1764, partial [Methanomicrobiaceae archaeon]|nr:hypothetical protein [Methanomicrobiaceae archaeon]